MHFLCYYQMMKFKIAVYCFLFFNLGLFLGRMFFNRPSEKMIESRLQKNYQFINPLLECDTANFSRDQNLDRLRNEVANYIKDQQTQNKISFASVYFRDLNNGPWFGINEKENFSPASLVKVPLMIAYLKLSESNPNLLSTKLKYQSVSDSISQNIIPEETLTPDQEYTIEELIKRMIVYSDNRSYDLLNQNITFDQLIRVYNDLGVDISKGLSNPNGDILTVKSYASFFRILFNSSYLSHDDSEKALKLLSQSTFTQGLVAGVPQSTKVSHKFGERNFTDTGIKQFHDCGIIYHPQKPYLLCVMTRGKDFNQLIPVIKQISSTIYQTVSR